MSRPNPEGAWIVVETLDLRIVSQDLWDAVKKRQKKSALPKRGNHGGALGKARRPRFLLSGLLTCGSCGGGMSMISQTHVGCSSARNKGTCDNRKSIARREVEKRVLDALAHRLMDPELFSVFCGQFVTETNRIRFVAGANQRGKEKEPVQVKRGLDRLVQALIDGAPASTVKDKMAVLEVRRDRLQEEMEGQSAPPPAKHPNLSELYRSKVSNLAEALNTPEARTEAAESLRGLIDRIVLAPGAEEYAIDLRGDLAGILSLAEGKKGKTAQADVAGAISQVSSVAWVGFDLCRTSGTLAV